MTLHRHGSPYNDYMDFRNWSSPQPYDWPEHQSWIWYSAEGGDDLVLGSPYNDAFYGDGGNDTLYGFDGHDALHGGNGDDQLYGGNGDDYLDGGSGNDILSGGNGKDWLKAGAGDDRLWGGAGNDVFVGDSGTNDMYGGAGNDTFFGGSGLDRMYGQAGNDRLLGRGGNDQYYYDGQGIDTVNEGASGTGQPRDEPNYDNNDILIVSYSAAETIYFRDGDNLLFTSKAEVQDGHISNAVIVEDFYKGGHYTIESLYTTEQNGTYSVFDLTSLLTA